MTDRIDSEIKLASMDGGGFCTIKSGLGAPVHYARLGGLYLRLDGGVGSTLYVKETDETSNVWAAK